MRLLLVTLAVLLPSLAGPLAWSQELPLTRINGVYEVPVQINNTLTVKFILDTGAAEVSLSEEVVEALRRSGTLTGRDNLPERVYTDASGGVSRLRRVLLRSIKIGGYEVRNVAASVGGGGLRLLGQSFLTRIPAWSIDNRRQLLVLGIPAPPPPPPVVQDANAPDSQGRTPLMQAALQGDIAAVRQLLGRGADINRVDNAGWTALMLAADRGNPELVKLIAGAGADVNTKNGAGWSALLSATVRGDASVAQTLIEAGANVNVRNNVGLTPLTAARQRNDTQMIEILKRAGAN